MIRYLALFIGLAALAAAQAQPVSVTLTWLGQSAFVMETSTGLKALLDPINMGEHSNDPAAGVDVVAVTHEHPDHNAVGLAVGSPTVLRGLAGDDFAKIDQTMAGVRIRTVASYHDVAKGEQRGKNAIFVFELPGLKVVHVGDLGQSLDAQQISEIGPVDVLLIPVSGGPTIDPNTAVEVAGQLSAKVVIPMHYALAAAPARGGFSLGTLDNFLKVLGPSAKVVRAGHTLTLTAGDLPAERTVMVMENK